MKNSYKFRFLFLTSFIIFLILFTISLINSYESYITYLFIFALTFSLTMMIVTMTDSDSQKKIAWLERRMKLWNSISYRVKKAGEKSFNDLPLAIIVYDEKKEVEWANNYAKDIFQSPLVERRLDVINETLYKKLNKEDIFDLTLYGKIFECKRVEEDNILYMIEKTEMVAIEKKYKERMLAIGVLNLDNLEQSLTILDPQEKALQMSNVIGILGEWSNKHKIFLKGFSEEKYLLVMDYSQLENLIKEKFIILEKIKEYFLKENLRISASLGIACKDIDSMELVDLAEKQLMLATNRGGNQCVVCIDNEISYFGAKTTSFETRTPVFIRVKTEELCDLIRNSSNVIIMGHDDMDADSFGACLGIRKIVQSVGKDVSIIFDKEKIDQTVLNVFKVIEKEHINILDGLITSREAYQKIDDQTLLVLVDCQYQNLLMNERIYKKTKKVAIIDHHRRSTYAINNYDFLYIQPSASSSVELVVEMFEFVDMDKVQITPIEATWMLMGTIVDTNNLMYRTSFRTFNVLAFLQKYGADISKVKRYLRENFEDYVKKMNIMNSMEIVEGVYGVAICDEEVYPRQFLAKIADNIISVNNIKAGFCIGNIEDNQVGVSARSLDESNVQIIMEQMGGGGHFNNSATQLDNTTIEEAKEKLISILTKINEGDETAMKIILTKDVKGKGKIGDIIDIPSGHANFLIRSNQAIEATADNVKQLEMAQEKEKQVAEKLLQDMKDLKKEIELKPVTVQVRVGKEGKLFGTVSTKQIVDEYKAQNNIELDKRKMLTDKEIDSLGTYTIPIQLHKEVVANITLYVVELK